MENTNLDISLAVGRFKEEMQKLLYGRRLSKIILYGSYARNDFRDESDVDILVVLDDEHIAALNEKKIIRKTIEKWSEDNLEDSSILLENDKFLGSGSSANCTYKASEFLNMTKDYLKKLPF